MKKIKVSLMAVAAIASVVVAFAFSPKANNFETYYPYQTSPGHFAWETASFISTEGLECLSGSVGCAGFTGTKPAADVIPNGYNTSSQIYR